MDVGDWLRSLDLGQYEAAFRDNDVDDEVLRSLTGDDLKELGVATVGHRRKLLIAIEHLAAGATPKPAAPDPPPVATNPPPPGMASAERRHLTVMFCDLVGSTSISAQ